MVLFFPIIMHNFIKLSEWMSNTICISSNSTKCTKTKATTKLNALVEIDHSTLGKPKFKVSKQLLTSPFAIFCANP